MGRWLSTNEVRRNFIHTLYVLYFRCSLNSKCVCTILSELTFIVAFLSNIWYMTIEVMC